MQRRINEMMAEIESSEINLKPFKPKNELEPHLWVDGKLDSRVRLKLLDIADDFIKTLNIKWVKPLDIVLTGSIANYNWSEFSDIDVHVIMDYDEVSPKREFVEKYFKTKRDEWSEAHDELTIFGYPVEMFVEDSENPSDSSGVYSLNSNKWLVKPTDMKEMESDPEYVKDVAARIITKIETLCDKIETETDTVKVRKATDKLEKIYDYLKHARQKSLKEDGEMGFGNILWKIVKHMGYIEMLWDCFNTSYDKSNSLNEGWLFGAGGMFSQYTNMVNVPNSNVNAVEQMIKQYNDKLREYGVKPKGYKTANNINGFTTYYFNDNRLANTIRQSNYSMEAIYRQASQPQQQQASNGQQQAGNNQQAQPTTGTTQQPQPTNVPVPTQPSTKPQQRGRRQMTQQERDAYNAKRREKYQQKRNYFKGRWVDQNAETMDESENY